LDTSIRQSAVLVETREGEIWVGADVPMAREETGCFFGMYNSPRLLYVAQESMLSPSGDVVTPVDVLAIEVANVQTGVWERRDGRWSESRPWRFVDIDDLVSCD